MDELINQAVVFTKPLHHLNLELSPDELDEKARTFLKDHGFRLVEHRRVTGAELAEREVIRQHYLMYSTASFGDFSISPEGEARFRSAFNVSWESEMNAGRIVSNPELLNAKGINADQLFELWNVQFSERKTAKIQDGLIMAWIDELDCYCINAFYPALESNFNHAQTRIDYYVVEFDPEQVSWEVFRQKNLGSTNAAQADPESFRGQIYSDFPVEHPGRDNFVHGSAGPFEGLIERIIHEPDFKLSDNPLGARLEANGVDISRIKAWKGRQSVSDLGALFDATEEKNTGHVLKQVLSIDFQS